MVASLSRDMALGVEEPALSSLFMVRLPNVFSLSEVVAEQVTATFYKTPAQARFSNGSNDYYPGITDIDGISITFYETHDFRTSQWLNLWRAKIYDSTTGNFGVPKDYKQNIIIELYSPFKTTTVKSLTYIGCWPTDKGPYELNYSEETGRITVQAQFSVDSFKE